jgi:hypothetical protein
MTGIESNRTLEAGMSEPVFPKQDEAIDYAQNGACFRSARFGFSIRVVIIERVIPFYDANRRL